ncbi:MAG: hypothetical protein ABSF90_20940, partial [Syntrophobacteraceae bacterium]
DGEGMASLTSGSGMCFKRITYKGWVNFGCLKWVSFQRRLTPFFIRSIFTSTYSAIAPLLPKLYLHHWNQSRTHNVSKSFGEGIPAPSQ